MNQNEEFEDLFRGSRIMAILRGMGAAQSLEVSQRAWDLGITSVEIPVQSSGDLESLRAVSAAAAEHGLRVGAGTVVSASQIDEVHAAGASFTVSPGLDLDVVAASHAAGMPSIPGVATATEVQRALRAGLTWLKAFPASVLTPEWFKAMKGPFPEAKFVATGGMDSLNAKAFLDRGVKVVAVGSALEDDAQLPKIAQLVG